jgi:hypothetical protein
MKLTPLHEGLARKLEPLERLERESWQRRALTLMLAAMAIAIPLVAWWALRTGIAPRALWLAVAAVVLLLEVVILRLGARRKTDPRELARRVELEHPELRGALLAALEQEAAADGSLGYLQTKVFQKALAHGAEHDWVGEDRRAGYRRRGRLVLASAALFAVSMVGTSLMMQRSSQRARTAAALPSEIRAAAGGFSVAVVPGDAEVERGMRLVVEARFKDRAPAEAGLALVNADETPRASFVMNRTVDGNVFGGVITDIKSDANYRVEFEGGRSETYRITTFDYPALVRADATVTPPAWTEQPPATVKNTMNIGVMEGSRVDFRMTVNKPLASAELFGEDKTVIALKPKAGDARVIEGGFVPLKSQKYRLHLVDDRERANKNPTWFTVRVLPNQPPKLEMTFPKRDLAVSPIQEMPVEGRVWDDLGVLRAGATFMLGETTKEVSMGGEAMKGGKKHDLKTLFNLEPLHAEPRQMVSYYLWAEDKGADGKPRRTMSDMFFAEVRHFEDIFREAESPPGADKEEKEKGDTDELMATQKEVVNATWRVLRDSGDGRPFETQEQDVGVLHESQDIVKGKTEAAIEKVKDAEIGAALRDAVKSMAQASSQLAQVSESRKAEGLNPALGSERRALELLQRAQSREHKVMRSQSSKGKGKQGKMQQQLNNLELKQQEKRYEEQKEAGDESTAEQKENLQVLNRLKELAARQEALAQKMKELEQQSQQAKSDAERQELDRQLKRLQEEQEQLLRDVDLLKERMEKPDNLAQMSDMREKLEQAREQARQAAEQLAQQKAAQASANATKAQRQIEEVRDEFRERTAKKFASEMRELKEQARKLESDEKKISDALENGAAPKPDPAGDTSKQLERALEGGRLAAQMDQQQKALEKTLDDARKITEAAEVAEPALSSALYDAARKAETGGTKSSMEAARDLASTNDLQGAQRQEQKAAKGITELRENIERAADQVLGSETEALRVARAELDKLMRELEAASREEAAGKAGAGKDGKPEPGDDKKLADSGKAGKEAGEGGKPSDKPDEGGGEPKPGGEGKAGKEKGMAEARGGGKPDQPGAGEKGQAGEAKAGQEGEGGKKKAMAEGRSGGKADQPEGGEKGRAGAGKPGEQTGKAQQGGGRVAQNSGARGGADSAIEGDGGGWFFDAPSEATDINPITGGGYDRWSDRLRNVEELLEAPELRGQAARIRDEARQLRIDHRRNNQPPQAAVVSARITQPLAELRDRVAEELARRESANPLAPLDHDPVPARFREQVRRYYTELGAGK